MNVKQEIDEEQEQKNLTENQQQQGLLSGNDITEKIDISLVKLSSFTQRNAAMESNFCQS